MPENVGHPTWAKPRESKSPNNHTSTNQKTENPIMENSPNLQILDKTQHQKSEKSRIPANPKKSENRRIEKSQNPEDRTKTQTQKNDTSHKP